MASTPGFEPGPHWWEASTLTTAPPLLPNISSSGISFKEYIISVDVLFSCCHPLSFVFVLPQFVLEAVVLFSPLHDGRYLPSFSSALQCQIKQLGHHTSLCKTNPSPKKKGKRKILERGVLCKFFVNIKQTLRFPQGILRFIHQSQCQKLLMSWH